MAASMKMAVFCVVAPCSLVEINGCFRGAYCLHHQGDASEMSENFYQTTRRNNPEDSHLQLLTCLWNLLKAAENIVIVDVVVLGCDAVGIYLQNHGYNPEEKHLHLHRRENSSLRYCWCDLIQNDEINRTCNMFLEN
jgi:hypothetical protein